MSKARPWRAGGEMMVVLSLTIFLTILVLLLVDLFCDHLRRRRLRAEAARLKLNALLLHRGRLVVKTVVAHEALSRHAAVLLRAWRAPRANTKDFLLANPKLESAVTSPSWRPHIA
jgi:hypothetical protein